MQKNPDPNLIAFMFLRYPLDHFKKFRTPFKHNVKIWQMKVSYILLSKKTPSPQTLLLTFKGPPCSTLKKIEGPPFSPPPPPPSDLRCNFPCIFQGACLPSHLLCVTITKIIFKELQALNNPPTLVAIVSKHKFFTKNSPFLKCFYYFKILMKLLPSRIFSHEDSF